MNRKVGTELEGFVSRDGVPVDVHEWLAERVGNEQAPKLAVAGAGIIMTDAGRNQIEFALDPADSPDQLQTMIEACLAQLPQGWDDVAWVCENPHIGNRPSVWAPKPRYAVALEALQLESGNQDARWQADYAALQFHTPTLHHPRAIHIFNWLNNWGPWLARTFAREWNGGRSTPRLSRVAGDTWGRRERLYTPRWFNTMDELIAAWQAVPRLIQRDGKEWGVDLQTRAEIGDPLHEGTIWWGVRPRFGFGTWEFRYLDSLPLAGVLTAFQAFRRFVDRILAGDDELYRFSDEDWWRLVRDPAWDLTLRRDLASVVGIRLNI